MLRVLFLSQGNSNANLVNFVPVLLGSVLEAQPKLNWEKIGDLTYFDVVHGKDSLPDSDAAIADIVCHTVYTDTLLSKYKEIKKTQDEIRACDKNALMAVGGPVSEDLAEAVLLRTGADFFFAGSALHSFRKFCEHVKECRENNIPLDCNYIRTLPGVYQRFGKTIVRPDSSIQETRFIKELVLYPESVFLHNLSRKKKPAMRLHFPYPMYNKCNGKCSFCDYDPVGVPLSREQKQGYVEHTRGLASQLGLGVHFHWAGPNFDFGDKTYRRLLAAKEAHDAIMCRLIALLNPSQIGSRTPNTSLITEMIAAGVKKFAFGIESLVEEKRAEIGKQPFTNEELFAVLDAIRNAKAEVPLLVSIFILPPDISTSHVELGGDSVGLKRIAREFSIKRPLLFLTTDEGPAFVASYPGTPDFEVIRIFHSQFPESFQKYYGRSIRKLSGNSTIPILYTNSFPLDPIARIAGEITDIVMEKAKKFSLTELDMEIYRIPMQTYMMLLALYNAQLQFIKSQVVMSEEYNSGILQITDMYRQLIEKMEREDLPGIEVKGILQKLKASFTGEYEENGRKRLERFIRDTPLRDPKAYELWQRLGEIRKRMTMERKAGNPEWRLTGRRLIA